MLPPVSDDVLDELEVGSLLGRPAPELRFDVDCSVLEDGLLLPKALVVPGRNVDGEVGLGVSESRLPKNGVAM